jgi:hypothetical protein
MTRVRIIYQIGPSTFTGKLALNQVIKVCASYGYKAVPMPGQPLWKIVKELVTLTQKAGYDIGRFMVYRESRHVKLQRSPYKQMLRTLFGRAKLQPPAQRINTQAQAHPKLNKLRSRTVKLLEQELMLQD